jgi:hypothetical protein
VRAALARALLSLASCCLGESRRGWALAMQAELDAATAAGRPLAFAAGCLIAAWREMPRHSEGRLALANNALALGLLVPMAGLQFASAAGFPLPFWRGGGFYQGPVPGSVQDLYLYDAFAGAVPTLLGLSLFLCLLQLRFAWLLLERDWRGVVRIGALIAASVAALAIFTGVLFLDGQAAALQASALAVDLLAALALAQWQGRAVLPAGRWGDDR